jgi:hypothetical protein
LAASVLNGYSVRMRIPFRLLVPILPTLGGCVYVDATAYRPPPIYITPSPTYVPPPSRDPNEPIQLQTGAGEPPASFRQGAIMSASLLRAATPSVLLSP